MTLLVLEASVVAKWFLAEEHSPAARRLLRGRYTLLAPDLIWSECGNIIWKHVRRGELSADEAREIIDDVVRLPLEIGPTQALVAPALELAIALDRAVYDCVYLAMAIARQCRLVTADDRFVNALAATPFGRHLRHVAKLR
jgi:predicted nucleic acid-binding protein